MTKTIKTKENVKSIKEIDKKENHKHFIKKAVINNKRTNIHHSESQEDEKGEVENYAVDKVSKSQQKTVSQVVEIKKRIHHNRIQKSNSKKSENNTISQTVSKDNNLKFKIKSKDTVQFKQYPHVSKKIDKKQTFIKQKIPILKKNEYLKNNKNQTEKYQKSMKQHAISKYKSQIKQSFIKKVHIPIYEKDNFHIFEKSVNTVKKTVTSVNNIVTLGMGIIVIIVIALFIGVFSALSQDTSSDSSSMYVSEEVLAYTPIIEHYAMEYGIADFVPLIQAVMMQESGGKGNDPMQASESGFNTKYPRVPNGITDPDYSIMVGIQNLAECMNQSYVKDTADMKNISLALQGYNYGNGYISWALKYFGGYTKANAKVFSDEMKQKLNTDVYGDPDYVPHVLRYYHLSNGDIVMIARSQIGTSGGSKYWKWYGFESRVEWCAIFVSWCANESDDLNVSIPKFSRVEDGIKWYTDNGRWQSKDYLPKSGDLIFFDWDNDNDPDHVGIVETVNEKIITTIEGNSSDEVKRKEYKYNSSTLFGYGSIL